MQFVLHLLLVGSAPRQDPKFGTYWWATCLGSVETFKKVAPSEQTMQFVLHLC
jgi:hypothetical protein